MNKSVKRAFALVLPAVLWGCSPPENPQAGVLMVGPGMAFSLPSEAAKAAKPGNVIRIAPGTYKDCVRWEQDDLVIEGTGDGVVITDKVCEDKALFITRGHNITVRNITFSDAHASTHNGAGIRAEGADLIVENSRFIDNEDGILAADNPASALKIRNSFFKGNGNCIAACAHGIYATHLAFFRVENSDFEEQHVGHHIKSRAARTEIVNNTVHDGPSGSASYLIDIPNGGSALITGNKLEKGPLSENRNVAISIGGEGPKPENPPGEIVIKDNEFINDTGVSTAFVKNYTGMQASLQDNRFSGPVVPLVVADPPASPPP
jgi:hypothetical protein